MPDRTFLVLTLVFLLVHEMDAIYACEWRIFPLTAWLSDRIGYRVFTAIHLPLYVWFLGCLANPRGISPGFAIGLDCFALVHVGLHVLFLRHPKNQFTTWFSWMVIVGAGSAGLLDLIVGR